MTSLTHSRLIEVLDYAPETGVFRWKVSTTPSVTVGAVAGTKHGGGYIVIMVDHQRYLAHRLAWFFQSGQWPERLIDHINGCPNDNRFCNLREASDAENSRNAKRPSNNTSGFKGVRRAKGQKWQAAIRVDGKRLYLGRFDTPESAYAAYCAAAEKHHGDFARY